MSLAQSREWSAFRIPTPYRQLLTNYQDVLLGHQDQPGAQPRGKPGSIHLLKPVLFSDSRAFAVPCHTATLAQQFITSTTKRWLEDQPMQLRMEISPNDKLMLWTRMLMVNLYERVYLKKACVTLGIMASIYKCQIDPSLVAAFLTYWNVDGHTLVTSQGEMGYPLHTMYDVMGIPISGCLYEEFIPLPSTVRGYVQTYHNHLYQAILLWVGLHLFGARFLYKQLSCPVMDPPFVIDFRDYESMDIKRAHNLFRDFNDAGTALRSLDFLGRSNIRFPTSDHEVELFDDRSPQAHRVISMAAVDFLVSCTVGSVNYRRGEISDNLSISIPPEHWEKGAQTEIKTLKYEAYRDREDIGSDRSGKDIEKIRACVTNSGNVTTHASPQASQQELLALSSRCETVLNSSAMTHMDPYGEGLSVPPDDISTLPADLLTREFPDLATLLDGGADPETGLYLDSPTFLDATQKDNSDSHLRENDEARTGASPDTGKEDTSHQVNPRKLCMDIEHIIAQVPQAPNINSDPVTLPKLPDVVSELLKKRPVQEDVVLKEINIILDLWSNFFSKPPPEIIRLMGGLRMLKRGEAQLPSTDLVLTQQDQINQHVTMLRTTQDEVNSSCVAFGSTDKSI
uniref:Aminotransferase-like plant mobile domain-containing protein n=1 Tax=Oryza punctata TaxID=4537 RepID=A0A0E0L0B2_ORYPU